LNRSARLAGHLTERVAVAFWWNCDDGRSGPGRGVGLDPTATTKALMARVGGEIVTRGKRFRDGTLHDGTDKRAPLPDAS